MRLKVTGSKVKVYERISESVALVKLKYTFVGGQLRNGKIAGSKGSNDGVN